MVQTTGTTSPDLGLDAALADAAQSFGASLAYDEHFVGVRRTHGGPAPSETACPLDRSSEALAEDRGWV